MDLSKIENFQDAIVTVMGLGRYKQGSGLGAAKWLIRHGAQIVITDLKDESELAESMSLVMEWYEKYKEEYKDRTIYPPLFVLGEHREADFVDVDVVVQNPGVPSEDEFVEAAKKAGVPIESDVSLFFRYYPHPIIAVTGTKGKTTTTKMIDEMLLKMDSRAIMAGNVKVSPLEHLDSLLQIHEPIPIVIELSSWILESMPNAFKEMKKGPDISVLTNVYPDHLIRYHSYGDYIHSKEIIFEWQSVDQYTILNWDHETVRAMGGQVKGKLFWCSREYQDHNGCFIKDGKVVIRKDGEEKEVLPLVDFGLKGDNNIENILTSVCAAYLRNVPLEIIQQVGKEFKGASDAQELVREVEEISYINDTIATNPQEVISALKRFGADGDVILIAGGEDRGNSADELAIEIVKACKGVILFEGEWSDKIGVILGDKVPVVKGVKTMKDAVKKAHELASSGDVVLLSPASSGTGMYANEFERGEQFREEVRNL
ncbi:MAG: UDP-N-acetylmuramoyl-L-alanine--D-glutamate ligase [Candidatus Uhrbacteria bacterium]|nr:UDP-N-acetylmuramoyl-L-alanine--D-glutamate ligase [Candidatus Uhrbacteria bacterium]